MKQSDKELFIELERYKDGTSRMKCKYCGNTYRLSHHTVDNFNFCPKCGKAKEA